MRVAGQDGAQEPARPVDTDESGRGVGRPPVRALRGHASVQFDAQRAELFLGGAATTEQVVGYLVADVVPDALALGRREGLHLTCRTVDDGRDTGDLLAGVIDVQPKFHTGLGDDRDRTEVQVAVQVLELRAIERSVGTVQLVGTGQPGQLVGGGLVVRTVGPVEFRRGVGARGVGIRLLDLLDRGVLLGLGRDVSRLGLRLLGLAPEDCHCARAP